MVHGATYNRRKVLHFIDLEIEMYFFFTLEIVKMLNFFSFMELYYLDVEEYYRAKLFSAWLKA